MTVVAESVVAGSVVREAWIPGRLAVVVVRFEGSEACEVSTGERLTDWQLLPARGSHVRLPGRVGHFLGAAEPVNGMFRGWLLTSPAAAPVAVLLPPSAWMADGGPALEASPEVFDALVAMARAAEREREEWDRWRDELISDAHEWADDNSLCGEFDRFMSAHDLPAREREYDVTLEVTFDPVEVVVSVLASTAEAATEAVDSSMVRDAVRDRMGDGSFEIDDWTSLSVEVN